MTPEWLTAIATAAGAIATFLAVLAALGIAIWGEQLRAVTSRPKLTLSIAMHPPDCHRIQVTVQMQAAAVPLMSPGVMSGREPIPMAFDAYYFRLAVGNDGSAAAKNVAVRAIQLSKLDAAGEYQDDPHFMPMNLIWSHVGSVVSAKIDPELPQHCDLAHVDDPSSSFLQFCTEVTPNQVAPGVFPTVKPAGTYRLRVAATADNSRPVYRTLTIAFDGNWYPTEKDMFTKGVVITAS